jgi:hypothetical protein
VEAHPDLEVPNIGRLAELAVPEGWRG